MNNEIPDKECPVCGGKFKARSTFDIDDVQNGISVNHSNYSTTCVKEFEVREFQNQIIFFKH
jgi:hypothetical protein